MQVCGVPVRGAVPESNRPDPIEAELTGKGPVMEGVAGGKN